MPKRISKVSAKSKKAGRVRRRRGTERQLNFSSLEDRRMLATFTVNSNADFGAGTLRDAITVANITPGADEIVFASNVTGAINTNSELPTITEDLTISGPGQDVLAIDANQQSRVINVEGSSVDLTINDLTLRNGRTTGDNTGFLDTFSGGGIRFDSTGSLTLNDSAVTGNRTEGVGARGGGIFVDNGDLVLTNSTVSGNSTAETNSAGGGISSYLGDVTLTNSTVSGNSTAGEFSQGGGIYKRFGDVTLTNSTVSENSTAGRRSEGGGIYALADLLLTNSTVSGNSTAGSDSDGGGIHSTGSEVFLTNSTVSGNSTTAAQGGIVVRLGELFLNNSTVTGNSTGDGASGSGIIFVGTFSPLTLSIQNSIVAGNSSGVNDVILVNAFYVSLDVDFSVIGDATGSSITSSTGNGNLLNIDPLLGPLANNGGPTKTHALLPGSPAIDTGDPTFDPNSFSPPLNTDQRGGTFSRVQNGDFLSSARVDIGAFEFPSFTSLVVSTDFDESDGDFSAGDLSLREAILLSNTVSTPTTITFSSLFDTAQTIDLVSQLPTITTPLTITGPGQSLLTIDAGNGTDGLFATRDGFRLFDIDNGDSSRINVTLSGLTLTGGNSTGNGGAILNEESLRVLDSTLVANNGAFGGAIASTGNGSLILSRSTISGNLGRLGGGGLSSAAGDLEIDNSTIDNNYTTGFLANLGSGGGIYAFGALVLEQSTVSGNRTEGAGADGGGIYAGGNVEINRSTITANATQGNSSSGGGIFFGGDFSDSFDIFSTILSGNTTASGAANDFADALQGNVNASSGINLIGSSAQAVLGGNSTNLVSNDPQLGPLADNGGPTRTHLPLEGSPVIDAGNTTSSSGFDQRGAPFDRVFGSRIDIGSVELQPAGVAPTVVNVVRDEGGVLARPDLISTYAVTFDQDVVLSADDLIIRNDTLGGTVIDSSSVTFVYDSGSRTATWSFGSLVLDAAFYTFELSSDVSAVAGGLSLDGNGDGIGGDNFSEEVYVAIPGDANLDGVVNVLGDAFILVGNLGTTSGAVFADGDFNGDGVVNVLGDAFILVGNLGQSVVPPASGASVLPPASMEANPSSTSSALQQTPVLIQVNQDSSELAVDTRKENVIPVAAKTSALAGSQSLDEAFASEDWLI